MFIFVTIVCLLISIWLYKRPKYVNPGRKFVVVTGCDSGIGLELAKKLSAWQFSVIACCLNVKGAGARTMSDLANVKIVQLDLRNKQDIHKLKSYVQNEIESGKEFHCLVNNAAVMSLASFEWLTCDLIQEQININIVGTMMVTRVLLPMLRRSAGRIVIMSSPQGQISSPKLSLYCVSKAGLEAFAHSLRREMNGRIYVSIVRPCALPFQTRIMAPIPSQLKTMKRDLSPDSRSEFGGEIDQLIAALSVLDENVDRPANVQDRKLFEALRMATMGTKPSIEYDASPYFVKILIYICQMSPAWLVDFLYKYDIPLWIINKSESK